MPILHLLAGPNGAGKSTLYRSLIAPRYPGMAFVNAGKFVAEHLSHVARAARRSADARAWADMERARLLELGESFVTETVFSHPSKLELMVAARSHGFDIVLYIVCVDEPGVLLQRVRKRVAQGGHDVPAHKVVTRYSRTIVLLEEALALADLCLLFDGADAQADGPRLVASIAAARLHLHTLLRPRWVEKVLGFAEA